MKCYIGIYKHMQWLVGGKEVPSLLTQVFILSTIFFLIFHFLIIIDVHEVLIHFTVSVSHTSKNTSKSTAKFRRNNNELFDFN